MQDVTPVCRVENFYYKARGGPTKSIMSGVGGGCVDWWVVGGCVQVGGGLASLVDWVVTNSLKYYHNTKNWKRLFAELIRQIVPY